MGRKPRSAPDLDYDPFDEYSTWDIRIAKLFYYSIIIAALITALGIWGTIIGALIEGGQWELFLSFDLSLQIAIIAAAVTGHLFLLVLFYILFRGGLLKMCRVMYKDRIVAKKWEDYGTLRFLIAIALTGVYITVVGLIIWIIPGVFFESLGEWWIFLVTNFNFGNWILYIGIFMFIVIGLFFLLFVLWNHGVYAVLKQVKTIDEQEEVKHEIKKETVQDMSEKQRRKLYHKETGKNAIYRGKETKGYLEWKGKHMD